MHVTKGIIRTKRVASTTLVIGLCIGFVAALYALLTLWGWGVLVFGAYWATALLLPSLLKRWPQQRHGELRADNRGIWCEGRQVALRHTVKVATLRRDSFGVKILLHTGYNAIEVCVEDESDAHQILRAMRLDASLTMMWMNYGSSHRAKTFARRFVLTWAVAALAALVVSPLLSLAVFSVFSIAAIVVAAQSVVRVSVGSDGIKLGRLSKPLFIPVCALESASTDGREFRLSLRNGSILILHQSIRESRTAVLDSVDLREVVARINTVSQTSQRNQSLARAGHSTGEWMNQMTGLLRDSSFRAPSVRVDDLWSAVSDANELPSSRVGAILALRDHLDSPDRIRLTEAVESSATPFLRDAAQAIATEQPIERQTELVERLDDESVEQAEVHR